MMAKSLKAAKNWACENISYLDTSYLLAKVCKIDKSQLAILLAKDVLLSAAEWEEFVKLVKRRITGEPIAYILGSWGFWDSDFTVTPDTLVPRPDTETIIATVLNRWSNEMPLKVLDLGTGSGVIAICIAKARPNWQIIATDICIKALNIAKINAKNHNVNNINFYAGDWYKALPMHEYFDIIISNPPYISENDPHLQALSHEPKLALISADNGYKDLKIIIKEAANWLYPGGNVIVETGNMQSAIVKSIMSNAKLEHLEIIKDLSGNNRLNIGKLKG